MTYSITLTGNGAAPEDVKAVFEDTVRALRAIDGDPTGSLSNDGTPEFAADVTDAPLDDTTGDTETVDG
jgi:hypothetical protein